MRKFRDLLRGYRKSIDFSQEMLARVVGISRPYMNCIETGEYGRPNSARMKRLVAFFGLEGDELKEFYESAGFSSAPKEPVTMIPEDFQPYRDGLPGLIIKNWRPRFFLQHDPKLFQVHSLEKSIMVDASPIGSPHLVPIEKEKLASPENTNSWGIEAYNLLHNNSYSVGHFENKRNKAYAVSENTFGTDMHTTKAIQLYNVRQIRAHLPELPRESQETALALEEIANVEPL